MTSTDRVIASTVVALEPAAAFRIFTDEIDRWWRRGPRFRWLTGGDGTLRFEGGLGGRLVEVAADGRDEFELGRILAWEPGAALVFEFRARSFEPGQCTEVEIRFEPVVGGTRVRVEHRGWDALAADHPARHGLAGPAFGGMMEVWWGDLLVAARRHAKDPAP